MIDQLLSIGCASCTPEPLVVRQSWNGMRLICETDRLWSSSINDCGADECLTHYSLLDKGWLAIAKLKPLSLSISPLSMPKKAFDNVKIEK